LIPQEGPASVKRTHKRGEYRNRTVAGASCCVHLRLGNPLQAAPPESKGCEVSWLAMR